MKIATYIEIKEYEKVLSTRRAPKENFASGWEFPSGKIEVNETL